LWSNSTPDRDRVQAGRLGFVVAEAGAGHGQLEDLDHLGAQRPGKLRAAANRGLAGDAALLVSGGAQTMTADPASPVRA
jgi:hypothetical protein